MTAFIWDMDGTLIDSYEIFLDALEETFESFDLPFDRDEIEDFILSRSINELLECQPVFFEPLKKTFTANTNKRNRKVKLMPGAREVLNWTYENDIQNFLITHKGDNAFKLLKQLNIMDYFIEVLTSQSGFARKPSPESANYLIEKYNLDKSSTYYLGDRILDIEFAHHAGIQSINFLKAENSIKIENLKDILLIATKWEHKLQVEPPEAQSEER